MFGTNLYIDDNDNGDNDDDNGEDDNDNDDSNNDYSSVCGWEARTDQASLENEQAFC